MSLYFILKGVMDRSKHDCSYSLQPESAVVHINHTNYFILNIFFNILLIYLTFYFQTTTTKFFELQGELQLWWDLESGLSEHTSANWKVQGKRKRPKRYWMDFSFFFSPINILFTISKGQTHNFFPPAVA